MTSRTLLSYVRNKKVFVLSPHLDDALLSCGNLLRQIATHSTVTIINIFTKAHHGPYTFSAKKFLHASGFQDAKELFKTRKKEDMTALTTIGASVITLDLVDGLFRKTYKQTFFSKFIPEFHHIYPTYRWHIVHKVSTQDTASKHLQKRLEKVLPKNSILLVPFAVGNHVDHVITRDVAERNFKNIIYYVDFPYILYTNKPLKTPKQYKKIVTKVDMKKKAKLIQMYASQLKSLFENNKIPEHTETFFVKETL